MKMTILVALLALSACTGTATVGTAPPAGLTTTEYGCASAAAALRAINANFARLTVAQRATVAQAKGVTDPICLQATPPTLIGSAQAGFTGAVAALAAAAK